MGGVCLIMKLKKALKQIILMKCAKISINKNITINRYCGVNVIGVPIDILTVSICYNGCYEITEIISGREPEQIMQEICKHVNSYLNNLREKELNNLHQYYWQEKYQDILEL